MTGKVGAHRQAERAGGPTDLSRDASQPEALIPCAAWFGLFAESVQTKIPNVRKVGRYAFFALCSFGAGIMVAVPMKFLGLKDDFVHQLANVASLASFLALRDMSKSWDHALLAAAIAMEARQGGDACGSVHDSAAIDQPKASQ